MTSTAATSAGFSPAQVERAAAFSRRRQRRFAIRQALYAAAFIGVWASGLSRSMATAPGEAMDVVWNIAATSLAIGWLLSLPLALAGARDERRAGLTTSSGRTLSRSLVWGLMVVVGGAAWISQSWQVAVDGFGQMTSTLVTLAIVVLLVPVAFVIGAKPIPDTRTASRLAVLIHRAGVKINGVRVRHVRRWTIRENAFVIGVWPTHQLVVFDTLVDEGPTCLDATVAHELGHMRLQHGVRRLGLLLGLAAAVFVTSVALIRQLPEAILTRTYLVPVPAALFTGSGPMTTYATLPFHAPDPAYVPLVLLCWGAVGLVLRPVFVAFIRRQEESADRFAVRLTRDPEGFATLLRRLAETNLADLEPGRWARLFFSTHGSIPDRMAWVRREPLPALEVPAPPVSDESRPAMVGS